MSRALGTSLVRSLPALLLVAASVGCLTRTAALDATTEPAPRGAQAARSIELFATADLHGHLEPDRVRGRGQGASRRTERGGLALLGGFLKNARAHYPGRVLLLDGGDLFQGTLASNLGEGAAMVRAFNALGYAGAALGNHEFDYGPVGPAPSPRAPGDDPRGALRARMSEARFAILGANVTAKDAQPSFPAYTMTTVDGVPVGIVGGTSETLFQTTLRENLTGLRVEPLAPALLRAAQEAEARGARVVVATVHAGGDCLRAPRAIRSDEPTTLEGCTGKDEVFELARALAAAARAGGPRIRAIVAGHTHQPITAVVDGIPIIQSGKNGHYLSHLSIEVRGQGATAAPTGRFEIARPIEVCARWTATDHCAEVEAKEAHPAEYFGAVAPDLAVHAAIKDALDAAQKIAARPIGITLPDGLMAAYGEECPLGNFAADAVRSAAGSEIGFVNGGGLRADLPSGALTYGALYESFPFDNEVVTIEMTGAELRRMASNNLRSDYGFLSYSGLRVKAECKAGRLFTELTLDDGRVVDPRARYRVATLDFLARGGDGALKAPPQLGPPLGIVRAVAESAFRSRGGAIRPSDGIFDAAHRRVSLPGPRPLHCRDAAGVEEVADEGDEAPTATRGVK